MNITHKIKTLKNLTAGETTLSDYIIENPKAVIDARPQEIAQNAFVSVSTVYRLINKIGLNGLGELKVELAAVLQEDGDQLKVDYDYPISQSDSPGEIMKNLQRTYHSAAEEMRSYSDAIDLLAAVQAMEKAKVIDVYTASSNLYFAENFRFQMMEIGVQVNVPAEDYMQKVSAANSDDEHLAIVVSYGGRGATVREVMRILRESQTEIILITSTADNPLEKFADYIIYMASGEDHYDKISSFVTRFSLLYLFDTLYSIYFNQNPEKNAAFKKTNYQKINKELK